jgi:hypothetical protein
MIVACYAQKDASVARVSRPVLHCDSSLTRQLLRLRFLKLRELGIEPGLPGFAF